jgi:hypothetical protein
MRKYFMATLARVLYPWVVTAFILVGVILLFYWR